MPNSFELRQDGPNQGDPEDRKLFSVSNEESKTPDADTEAATTKRRHEQLMQRLADEKSAQAENRYQMAVDEDFYDSLQWTEEDALELVRRGQAPLVFNYCKTRVKWITGTQKRTRTDGKVLPRTQKGAQTAEVKTKVLKYVDDVNEGQVHCSAAFESSVIAGLGWVEDGVNTDRTKPIIYSGSENWKNIWHDRRSRDASPQMEDGRYIFREKVVDLDVAQWLFPAKKAALASRSLDVSSGDAFEDQGWYLGQRLVNAHSFDERGYINNVSRFGQRGAYISTSMADVGHRNMVRLTECWYRVPDTVDFIKGGDLDGKRYEAGNERHKWEIARGYGVLEQGATMTMRCMIATEALILWDGVSPYRHNRFPLIPIWCYRRRKDGAPYGAIRDVRDAQEDLNKRRSKALYILSNNRYKFKDGAIPDEDEFRDEAARPDGLLRVNSMNDVQSEKNMAEFSGNLELMQADEGYMQVGTGVTDELMGRKTNAVSGVAIDSRQEQGGVVSADLFESLRQTKQIQGQNRLSLSEQYMGEPQVVRITGDNKPIEWLAINQVDPVSGIAENDITAEEADFIVSQQDFRASIRQAQFQQISDLLAKLGQVSPQVVLTLLDLLIDMADDIPQKEEWLARIRKLNGQTDPAKEMSPEEEAAQQAQQQQQAQEIAAKKQMELERFQAETGKILSDALKNKANAGNLDAGTVNALVTAIFTAIQGAPLLFAAGVPEATDQILQGAGFKDLSGQGLNTTDAPALPATAPVQVLPPAAPVQPPQGV